MSQQWYRPLGESTPQPLLAPAAGYRLTDSGGPQSDHTVEAALATMRDLALSLVGERGKQDWALADVHDIEAFLAPCPAGGSGG